MDCCQVFKIIRLKVYSLLFLFYNRQIARQANPSHLVDTSIVRRNKYEPGWFALSG